MTGPTVKRGPGRPSKAALAAASAAQVELVAPPPESLEPAAQQPAPDVPPAPPAVEAEGSAEHVPAHRRENPEFLTGDELRALAHRRGIAKSEAARLSDEKLREQLRYRDYAQYEEA